MKRHSVALLHYLVIAIALSLPFWLDWKIVAIIVVVYHLIFTRGIGFCPLTVWQFGTSEEGFIEKHFVALLRLCGVSNVDRRNLKVFIRYGLPLLLVATSLLMSVLPQYLGYGIDNATMFRNMVAFVLSTGLTRVT